MSSKQHQVILDTLRSVTTHPTADELYPMVKKVMPSISLGTLYRNLNQLAEEGEILKLEMTGLVRRYDGHTHPHDHFRCTRCDKVYDLDNNNIEKKITKKVQESTGHKIHGINIEFYGICESCKKMEN